MSRPNSLILALNSTARQLGVTIVEIMIALAIISILASIALPSYSRFVQERLRTDAQQLLLENASRLQRCLTLAGAYDAGCNLVSESAEEHYRLNATLTATTWRLSAVPQPTSQQNDDTECQSLTLDNTGNRWATGTTPDICW